MNFFESIKCVEMESGVAGCHFWNISRYVTLFSLIPMDWDGVLKLLSEEEII